MIQEISHESFMVWAPDLMVYGPLELPGLIEWVKEDRIQRQTWVLSRDANRWVQAETIEELKPFWTSQAAPARQNQSKTAPAVLTHELRSFPAFAGLSNVQLEQFIQFGELVEAPSGRVVLRKLDPGDSLFFLLSGELRARVMINSEDKTLGRIKAGECFGETAMFMRTPRTADVVVESDARMLRVSSEAFLLLINQLPQVAAPVLFAMAKVMAGRVSERNRQFQREVGSEVMWR